MSENEIFAAFRTHERWIAEAMKEARLAADKGEVPVGAIIVRDGQVIGRGHNQVESLRDPTAHAEILAIGAAGGHGESWRLEDTTLYVTLEPCTMCCGAILLARIASVVFGASDPRAGAVVSTGRLLDGNPYLRQVEVVGGISAGDCGAILSDFFQSRRD
ncbi:MAG: tRNA adenosine(34) deaminase TadA [Candidatus Krumholzibacteria bacterium]|nr:tRNA adenosine(34) deaminase TadA [Candidatus Krumholzibacteria bacterium]